MSLVAVENKFENIKKFRGIEGNRIVARVLPGEYYVTEKDEVISTVLGSCVSACICDPELKIGGINHFLLPESEGGAFLGRKGEADLVHRYGNFAMESLINDILSMGGSKSRLQVKIFGGGKILDAMTDIGKRNIDFVRSYLCAAGLQIVSEDVGDNCPRKVNYYPATGLVRIKKLRSLYNEDLALCESEIITGTCKGSVFDKMGLAK
jgi:chemotaxis protein CheD